MTADRKRQTNPGRARAAERTREEILLAAARAFAKGGVRHLRMEDIAREAGYTGPALYSYFKSKADIFEALGLMVKQQFHDTFMEPLPLGLSFRQKLAMLVFRQLEVADRWRDLFLAHLMLQEAKAKPTREEALTLIDHIASWIALEGGADLGGHDPRDAAFLLMSITHGAFFKWLLEGAPGRLTDCTELIVSFFFHGISGPTQGARPSGEAKK